MALSNNVLAKAASIANDRYELVGLRPNNHDGILMSIRTPLLLSGLGAIFILTSACTSPPPPPSPSGLPKKFQCLTFPNAALRPGAVIRSLQISPDVKQPSATPDNLTVAYFPESAPSFSGPFANFEQEVRSGLSAGAVASGLKWMRGIGASLRAEASYSVHISAMDNGIYVMDDKGRAETVRRVRGEEGLLRDARYYFIKEAIVSSKLSYSVKQGSQIVLKADLSAPETNFTIDITPNQGKSEVRSERAVIACVYIEEITISIIRGSLGEEVVSINSRPVVDGSQVLDRIIDAKPAP